MNANLISLSQYISVQIKEGRHYTTLYTALAQLSVSAQNVLLDLYVKYNKQLSNLDALKNKLKQQ